MLYIFTTIDDVQLSKNALSSLFIYLPTTVVPVTDYLSSYQQGNDFSSKTCTKIESLREDEEEEIEEEVGKKEEITLTRHISEEAKDILRWPYKHINYHLQ